MWEVKEYPHELVIKNDKEVYHVFRRPTFDPLPDGKTLYEAFMSAHVGMIFHESIKKSYYAPMRGEFGVNENDEVLIGDYKIKPNGDIEGEITGLRPEEDITRFPGSKLPPELRKLLAKNDFFTKATTKDYKARGDIYIEYVTNNKITFNFGIDEYDKPVIYNVWKDTITTKVDPLIIKDYINLVDNWEEHLNAGYYYATFARFMPDGVISIYKEYGSKRIEFRYKPPLSKNIKSYTRYDIDFPSALTLLKIADSATDVLEVLFV